jgi:hypothetical protein
MADLERILHLLSNALRRSNEAQKAETQDDLDTIEINREYITQARELSSDLAKHDCAPLPDKRQVRRYSFQVRPSLLLLSGNPFLVTMGV